MTDEQQIQKRIEESRKLDRERALRHLKQALEKAESEAFHVSALDGEPDDGAFRILASKLTDYRQHVENIGTKEEAS